MHDMKSLTADLRAGGIPPEATVLIHSSMKSIGAVAGGADTVLDVLMAYFGKRGLLVFPTLSHRVVNAETPVFDVSRTPCSTGILPELFRSRPGVLRSLHPTHSVAAFGPDAAAFIAGHERFDSPCPRQSPWGRLYDRDAYIIFLGIPIVSNTTLHGVEEWSDVPGTLTESRQPLVVLTAEGRSIPVPSRRHSGDHSAYYAGPEAEFIAAGIERKIRFGDAECRVLRARPMTDLILAKLQQVPQLFTAVGGYAAWDRS